MRLAKVLGMIGRTCVSAGVLTLLFVVYQLWGTSIREAQAQNSLESEFEQLLDGSAAPDDPQPASAGPDTPTTAPAPPPGPPTEGAPAARLQIPAIGVDKIVVEGVSLDDLKRGPGHYPDTPMPGQAGNAAIAGHRTTYGAPFNRVDELENGDEIVVTTLQGSFRYEVTGQQIVEPTQVEVLAPTPDNRLTLTACHPKYSAAQRIIITARLVGEPAPAADPAAAGAAPAEIPGDPAPPDGGDQAADEGDEEAATIDGAGLSGEGASAWPAIMLALACGLVWLAAWLLGQLWQRWPAYLTGLPIFMFVLFHFFESFSRLLPANY